MKNTRFTWGLLVGLALVACSPTALDKVNPNGVTPETFYRTEDDFNKGVNAIYSVLRSYSLYSREYFFTHDLRSDDVASGGGQLETARNQLLTGAQLPDNAVAGSVFSGYYTLILRANAVITNQSNAQNVDAALLARLIGEARFLRALAYFDLVVLWGGVPLSTSPSLIPTDAQPRASVAAIYAFLVKELTDIQTALPATYPASDVGRPTRGAAQALLGRVYMQQGNYAAAKTELDKVRTSSVYRLVDNYFDNFREETGYNAESVFEVGYLGVNQLNWGSGVGDGNNSTSTTRTQEYSALGWRNLIPSDGLLAEYERTSKGDAKSDPRFSDSFYRLGDRFNNGKSVLLDASVQGNLSTFEGKREKISWKKYTSVYKLDSTATFYLGPMNMRVIRYAEVLLNLAECENELGNSAAALGYVNQVRARPSVAMPALPTANWPASTQVQVRAAIVHERRVEHAGEQIRNRDILRWRALNKLTSEPISYFQRNKFELLPIPQQELATNPKLTNADQNPGY